MARTIGAAFSGIVKDVLSDETRFNHTRLNCGVRK